jgi:hypothetical protein
VSHLLFRYWSNWVPHFYTLVDCLFGPWYISSFLTHVAFKPDYSLYQTQHCLFIFCFYIPSLLIPLSPPNHCSPLRNWACLIVSGFQHFISFHPVSLSNCMLLHWNDLLPGLRIVLVVARSIVNHPSIDDRLPVPRLIAKQSLDVSCFVHVVPVSRTSSLCFLAQPFRALVCNTTL